MKFECDDLIRFVTDQPGFSVLAHLGEIRRFSFEQVTNGNGGNAKNGMDEETGYSAATRRFVSSDDHTRRRF
jgi:hypothetical protein